MKKPEPDELKNSEERYRALFENAVDAIFIATSDGFFTDVNVSGERLLGYEPGELIGKGISDILHPEDMNRFLVVRESMIEGNARNDEWTLVRKDGTFIPVEISANMLFGQYFQAFVRDITERKRMEELSKRLTRHAALRAEVHSAMSSGEKSLQIVLQSTMESVVRNTDAAFARIWLLDETENVLQLEASAGIYTRIEGTHSRFKVGEYKIGEIAALKKSLFSNSILEIEQIEKEWAERERLVSFAGFPLIVNDKVIGVAAMFSRSAMPDDVLEAFESISAVIAQGVERKRAEDQLLLMKYTIDHVFDSAAIIAPDARFIFANDACCKSLGYTREELLKLTVHDIDPNFPVEAWEDHYNNLRAQKFLAFESNHRRKDGHVFPVELSLNIFEYNGQEYNFAFGRDITERKRSEAELREKQELLQTIFDNSAMVIYVKDLDGRALLVNSVFEEILGLASKDIIGKTEMELWQSSPTLQENAQEVIEDYRDLDSEVFKTGTPAQREESFTVAGVERTFLTIKCPIYDESGAPYAVCGISTDITERKRAENKLREKQLLLQAIFDNSPMMIYVKDLDGRIRLANRGFEEILQLSEKDIVGKTELELWGVSAILQENTQQSIEDYRQFDLDLFETGQAVEMEETFSVNGEERAFWIIKCPLYNESGEPYLICTISTDITERKRAEVELRTNQQLLQAIFDNITALINVKDLDGRYLIVNRSFKNSIQLSHDQISGKTANEIWELSPALSGDPSPSLEIYHAFDMETLAAGKALQKEMILPVKGSDGVALITKCLLYDSTGQPTSILTISTDITEIKRAEKEMRRLQTELEHAARAMTMGALASSIAHEVNQPLAGIVTNGSACLRWLAMDPPNLEEARNAVNRIIRDGNRAGEVIARTRALLKKTPTQISVLDINEIVQETITLVHSEVQKNQILLQTNFSAALPKAAGDKIQIQQVLLNLLVNGVEAIKTATGGGAAQLSVETRKYEENNILVAVKDSGVGLDAGSLDKIFEAFYTTKEDGMGMGLSISRSIIEAHGGRLWAIPNDGKGMTFQFTLPVETYKE
jgi:PAS domain S-box-containing protein